MLRRCAWSVVPVALLVLPVAGCSQEVPLGAGAPTRAAVDEPGAAPTVIPTDRNEGFQYCGGPGRYVAYDTFEVTGPVLAGAPVLDGSARLQDVTYARRPKGQEPTGGIVDALSDSTIAATNWKARNPLDGAHLDAGSYYLFVQLVARDDDHMTSVSLPFTTTQGAHTATYLQNALFDSNC
jgi:hypothetical protein